MGKLFVSCVCVNRKADANFTNLDIEAVAQRCSVKKVFLEISQNSQENTCARVSFFNKVFCLFKCLFKLSKKSLQLFGNNSVKV